jgi:hypothetical protein
MSSDDERFAAEQRARVLAGPTREPNDHELTDGGPH